MKTNIPQPLKKLIKEGVIVSIIQFGSSIKIKEFNDIDLGIIVKKGCYGYLIENIFGKDFSKFDISFIKEEETKNLDKFKFGNQGMHFAYSLKKGKIIYGTNPFKNISISKKAINDSIMTRLYDYIYDVRKAVTNGKISKDIKKRWPKFIRLSLYLIDPQLKYPDVLQISDKELNKYLNKHHIKLKNKKLLLNYETVWEKVLSKKNVI